MKSVVRPLAEMIFCLFAGGSKLKRIARSFDDALLLLEDGEG